MCTAANDSVPAQGVDQGSVPAQGLDVTWTGLGLTVKEKVCLAPCNGTLRAGSLNALMGPTGAGKTTLLAAIARRGPVTSGDVRYNGEPWSKDLKQRVAFVDQDDVVNFPRPQQNINLLCTPFVVERPETIEIDQHGSQEYG